MLQASDGRDLPTEEKIKLGSRLSLLGMVAMCTKTKQIANVEDAVRGNENKEVANNKLLEFFKR